MRQIVCLIIVAIYALGSGISGPSKPFGPSVKVQVEHTHEVAAEHDHHHHDIENDGGHEDDHDEDHDHDKHSEHKKSVPHSHDISISMVGSYVMASVSIEPVLAAVDPQTDYSAAFNDSPPKDRALSSIFRPPIA